MISSFLKVSPSIISFRNTQGLPPLREVGATWCGEIRMLSRRSYQNTKVSNPFQFGWVARYPVTSVKGGDDLNGLAPPNVDGEKRELYHKLHENDKLAFIS